MPIYNSNGTILLLFLALFPAFSAAIDLSQCFANVINCAEDSSNCTLNITNTTALSILRTSQGQYVTSTDAATALSYTGCKNYCGTGLQEFSWTSFAEQYAAWLLPYLSLVSQLPFGARRRADNLMSAILTLGSPALAGYSLYMTLLNARWVNDRLFAGIDFPNSTVRRSVVRVLSSLQQVPLRVHSGGPAGFEYLVVHPDNDNWWNTLAEEFDYSHRWSIASATSIAWVIIAYLFTVADSIHSVPSNMETSGLGTGTGWLWLFPIVVGWLVLSPHCDWHKRLYDTYRKATAPTHNIPEFALEIIHGRDPDGLHGGSITSPDELRLPPVYNYARTFSWCHNVYMASLFYRAAWRRKSRDRAGVDGSSIPTNLHDDVPRASRMGTCDQIIQYCRPHDHECTGTRVLWPRGLFFNMIVASLMSLQLQWGTTGAAFLVVWFSPTTGLGCRSAAYLIYGVLSTVVWMLLVLSSALGYHAHHLLDNQPIVDLERDSQRTSPVTSSRLSSCNCTSLSTGRGPGVSPAQSNLAIPLAENYPPNVPIGAGNVQSNSNSKPRLRTRRICRRTMLRVADWLRWIGKSLAIINAVGAVANSVFQYAGVYTNCYCDSSVFWWGASAFNVIVPSTSDIDLAKKAWIGGLALALCCCSFFLGSIYLIRDTLPT